MNTYTATTLASRAPTTLAEQVEAQLLRRLDADESYAEGTPLERAILAHCRATGCDIAWTDASGCVTVFGDVERLQAAGCNA